MSRDEQPSIENDDKWGTESRRWAIKMATEIYGVKPGERILELADLLYCFGREGRGLPHQTIVLAAAAATRSSPDGSPGEPCEIMAWTKAFCDYVKIGDLPERFPEVR